MSQVLLKEKETYQVWLDQGGNIGLRCIECGNARWESDFDVFNPLTGKSCQNCIEMKKNNVFDTEQKQINKKYPLP